jgi:hypothetical protein
MALGTDSTVDDELTAAQVRRVDRTPCGWRVAGEEMPDLLNAMVLADLLLAEQGDDPVRGAPPARAPEGASEEQRLRATVAQLEHALHNRVVVEQAIGVLAERRRIGPREAFEHLRSAARRRGRKVTDLARSVVRSCPNPLVPLPAELAREGCMVEGE